MSRDSTAAPAAAAPPELTPTDDVVEAVEADLRGSALSSEEALLEPAATPLVLPPDITPPTFEPDLRATLPTQTPTGEPAEIDPLKLDLDALKVVTRLRQHGHQAYFVGGCVRDLMLGAKPKDFDVATSAHPGEVRAIFRNCRLIGRRFRLAHVYFKGGKIIEVSTFRANPSEVEEVQAELEGNEDTAGEVENDLLITHDNVFGTAEQDARRRDFTINGLFYDIGEARVIDYVRGRRDLRDRLIRTIGDPEVRMREDPIRILRAVRFACKLNIDIESRTYAAMEGTVEDLPRCAPPRLLEDTFRLLRGGVAAPALKLLAALDALRILLPPVDQYLRQHGREGEKTFYAYAAALDEKVRSASAPIEDSILLAALLLPIMQAAPQPEQPMDAAGRPSVARVIEDLLNEFVRTARLPRRIAERCRSILIAQRTLSGERRRRGSLNSFRNHPLFNEALAVFEISVEASGQFRAELEAWKSGAAPSPKAGSEGPPRRRRRRRRRGGAAGENGPVENAEGRAEATAIDAVGPADLDAGDGADDGTDSDASEDGSES